MIAEKIPPQYENLRRYFTERYQLLGRLPHIDCLGVCDAKCCKDDDVHITIFDLMLLSIATGKKPYELWDDIELFSRVPNDMQMGFQLKRPTHALSLILKKPCSFLHGNKCDVYEARPFPCADFPYFGDPEGYPCREHATKIRGLALSDAVNDMRMGEIIYSDIFLFGIFPPLLPITPTFCEGIGLDLSQYNFDNGVLGDKAEARKFFKHMLRKMDEGHKIFDGLMKNLGEINDFEGMEKVVCQYRHIAPALLSMPFGPRTRYSRAKGGVKVEEIPEYL